MADITFSSAFLQLGCSSFFDLWTSTFNDVSFKQLQKLQEQECTENVLFVVLLVFLFLYFQKALKICSKKSTYFVDHARRFTGNPTIYNIIQRVLTLCEFHYCQFHYCDFSKLSMNMWLMRFYVLFVTAIFG